MTGPGGTRFRSPAWPVLAAIGVVGGLLSGLFGVGGGIIMVPLLVTFARMDQRRASATSLAAIVPTAVAGSIAYLVGGEVDLVAGAIIGAGAIGGAFIGSALLKRIPLVWLRWMFIVFILLVAVRLLFTDTVRGESIELTGWVAAGFVLLGLVMGIASGLFGIGGGVLAVPVMVALFGMSDLIAKGTSLVAMIPTSVAGTTANSRSGMVDIRSGLVVGGAATLAAIPGALLAFALPPKLSTVLFAVLLLAAATQLTVKALRAR